jgi:hypothetical protein
MENPNTNAKIMKENNESNEVALLESTPEQSLEVFKGPNSFKQGMEMAKTLAASSLVPKAYQGNVQNCIVALEMSNRVGVSPLMVMQNLHIIQGKPSWSSAFIIGLINSCGRFSLLRFKFVEDPEAVGETGIKIRACYAYATDLKTGEVLQGPTVTWKMALVEGWVNKDGSKWKTMPELMFQYRAAAFFGRLYVPDLMQGMQTVDEVIDVVNDKEPSEELTTAVNQLKVAKTEDDFALIKDSFPDLSDVPEFVKAFNYYHKINLRK